VRAGFAVYVLGCYCSLTTIRVVECAPLLTTINRMHAYARRARDKKCHQVSCHFVGGKSTVSS